MRPTGLNNRRCLDLRGHKFGLLSPLEIDRAKTSRVFWKCKCKCGAIKSVASKHLTSGVVTSCGCNQHRKGRHSPSWRGYEEISKKCWEIYRRNARYRNLDFSITPEYAWEVFLCQNRQCALTGLPLQFKTQATETDGTASLDRIDSKKGYIRGNVWWVDKKSTR